MSAVTERALIWRETHEAAASCPWAFDIVTGRGIGTYGLVEMGENFRTWREAFDYATDVLRKRSESTC